MLAQQVDEPMTTFEDPYWQAALDRALRAAGEAQWVLVPAEFLALHPRFAPLEYSWGLQKVERLAWCCSKDDVDRLAPWLHGPSTFYSWSNEVFVLGGNFRWSSTADAQSQGHLVAWHERVAAHRAGKPARESRARPVVADSRAERRVLVVGASGMGNVGDNLLAQVLAGMLGETGASVDQSGPDIDPLHVAKYDAVVVGAGGLIYASRDGSNESQNLANYLKFGPMGRHLGVPTALIGVGDQDHGGGIEASQISAVFARAALSQFKSVTTRDTASAALLERLGAKKPRAGSDLLFAWLARARAAVRPSTSQPARIALAGEFYRYPAFSAALGDDGKYAAGLSEGEFDVLVMSNDDESHAQRLKAALQRAGASASIVDLRDLDFDALVFLFASYRGLVTTRFHGLVLAAMAGTPVLAFDVADGKLARLLNDLGKPELLVRDTAGEEGAARLAAGLLGNLEQIPAERVEKIAAQVEVHRRNVRALTGIPLGMRLRQVAAAVIPAPVQAGVPAASRPPAGPVADLDDGNSIGLCWAASSDKTNGIANLGDSLSAVMVAALSGRPVRHVSFEEEATKLVAVGSIGHAIRRGTAVVWGAGVSIRGGVLAQSVPMTRYDVRAIRGPISAQHYRDFGIAVPDVFGDPVWLLPSIVHEPVEKKFELGVIPHIQDVERHHPDAPARADSLRYVVDAADAKDVVVINTWHEPTWEGLLAKLRLIRSCKRIVSQSFHGVVIAEAYGIPVLNFRYLLGAKNGPLRVDLEKSCRTDPRVWEFYKGGVRPHFHMYSQRRDDRSDWASIIRTVDALWEPFEFDAAPLVNAFPLPLAYDPLRGHVSSLRHVEALRF
jgi:polysaccharide pyruvyl transferase WcaK-like protein